jgi:DNA-binding MarR family transcriptional regulator
MGIGRFDPGFRMIPDQLWQSPGVEPVDLKVWCVLWFHARGREHTNSTDAALAETAGCGEATIRRAIARLERAGFLYRERTGPTREIYLCPRGRDDQATTFGLRVVG